MKRRIHYMLSTMFLLFFTAIDMVFTKTYYLTLYAGLSLIIMSITYQNTIED
jgi:hypothetical protein